MIVVVATFVRGNVVIWVAVFATTRVRIAAILISGRLPVVVVTARALSGGMSVSAALLSLEQLPTVVYFLTRLSEVSYIGYKASAEAT